MIDELEAYRCIHGHTRVPLRFVTAQDYKLGGGVSQLRTKHRKGGLSDEDVATLEALDFVFDIRQ